MLRRTLFVTLAAVLLVTLLTPAMIVAQDGGGEKETYFDCFTYNFAYRTINECVTCRCRQCDYYHKGEYVTTVSNICECWECGVPV